MRKHRTKKHKFMAVVPVPDEIRAAILRHFTPAFANVYAKGVTLAYNCGNAYKLPEGPVRISVVGYCRGETTDSLIVGVNGQLTREDGTLHHITLSVADGVQPKQAGIETTTNGKFETGFKPFTFEAMAVLRPLWVLKPERNKVLAA